MASNMRILAFAGSLRKDSWNKQLVKVAAQGAREAGAEVTELDLADLDLSIYNQDDESANGLPDGAIRFKKLLEEHDGLLIASPEYNSSMSAALKNAIDWASRPATADEPMLHSLSGKTAALMSASPGALGGLRGLVHLRAVLGNIGMLVLPDQRAISKASQAFDENGALSDPKQQKSITAIGARLAEVLTKLHR